MRTLLYGPDGRTPAVTEITPADVTRDLLIALLGWVSGARPPQSPNEAGAIMSAAIDVLTPEVVKQYLPNLGFEKVPPAQSGGN
jgi:hypothetical protein